jgi:hypothetical protein
MTLYAAADGKNAIIAVPQRLLLTGWKERLESLELRAIGIEFDRLIRSKKSREIRAASWLWSKLSPHGRIDWESSPLMHIWEKACQRDARQTCWCFGLLLWEHMMNRPDAWRVEMADLDDVPVAGTTYFRCRSSEETSPSRKMASAAG